LHHIGNARLFYLLLIIIGSSVLGLGIHSVSAETSSPNCSATPGPGVNYNDCDFTIITPPTFAGSPGSPVNLKGATFVGAQLSGVNFQYANLQTANFTRSDNNGANGNTIFDYANLTRATFEYVNPDEGTLSFQGADLHYVDFTGADLSFSELTSGADISGANFSGAILDTTDFTQSIMENVIFTSTTNIQSSTFNAVDFSGTKLTHLNLSNNNFDGANFLNANLTGTSLANAFLVDATIGGSSVATTFQNADLNYVDFTGATMSADTNFSGATLVGTTFACTGNPICTPSTNNPPVIYFDKLLITGGTSLVQVNATAWKIGAATSSGTHVQYTGVYATVGTTTIQQGSNLVCTPNNTIFPLGTTQVTCTATDPTNPANTSVAHFYIIIADTIPPTISTPTSVVAEATGPNGAMVTYHVTASDPVDGDVTSKLVCTPASGSQFALGSTTVACSVTDSAGNTASASFPVIVKDTTPPTITAANPQFQEATSSAGSKIFYHATAFDLVSGKIPLTGSGPTNYCTPINGTQESLGSTTAVTCSATDTAGNTASASFSVTVRDTTPPTITAPPNITTPATGTLTQVTLGTPTVSDTVDPNPIVTNNAPATGFPIGISKVIWTATDHSGNSATVIQTITITTNPSLVTITPPSDITTQATGPLTTVTLGTPTWTDPFDPNPTITNNASASGYPVRSTVVVWHLVDHATPPNTANGQQVVTIQDTTPPTITATNPQYVQATGTLTPITYHVTATDIVDGNIPLTGNNALNSCTPINGTAEPLGPTTVQCIATDSHHNTSRQTFTVIVQDTVGPVMTLTPNPVIVEAVNQNGAPVTFNVTATDIVTGHASATCTPSSGTIFGLGQTSVICTASDKQNPPNTSTLSFLVTVRDTTPPTITAPPNITTKSTGTLTQVTLGTPTVSDTVDPNPIVTNNAPATGFPVGTTIVTWTATDHSGNKATATQTVVILPQNTPGNVNGGASIGNGISFNMNVMSSDGLTFKGHLDYNDKSAKIDLDSVTITSLFVDSTGTKANFTGTATLNEKSGYTFQAYVIDNGNPGKNDFFQITIFDNTGHIVYTNSGKLTHGNLHVNNQAGGNNNNKCDSDPRDYSNSNSYPSNNDYWNPVHLNNKHWDNHPSNNGQDNNQGNNNNWNNNQGNNGQGNNNFNNGH
jgi:uncharacterized protein YjbI with pentapeptide repeats